MSPRLCYTGTMAQTGGKGMEAIAVRRAALADADKVRYRVYRDPQDFIAVIAESALMAVKVSGVEAPYRIVRDLPTEGITIKAEKLASQESAPVQKVPLALERKDRTIGKAELPTESHKPGFVPMQLRDLEKGQGSRLRILSPDQMAALMASRPEPAPPPAPMPVSMPEPEMEAMPEMDAVPMESPEPEPEPQPAPESAASAPVMEAAPEPKADVDLTPTADGELTPDQVARLLNE